MDRQNLLCFSLGFEISDSFVWGTDQVFDDNKKSDDDDDDDKTKKSKNEKSYYWEKGRIIKKETFTIDSTEFSSLVAYGDAFSISLHYQSYRDHTMSQALITELKAQYEAGDVVGGQETLTKLKIWLLEQEPGSTDPLVAIEILELGVLLTVTDGDLDAFARNVAQLKPYYAMADTNNSNTSTPQSERKCHILGLNLLHLLVDNRLSEFHAELELLTEKEASHPLVSFPIELERQLMVGMYDKVLNVQVPHPSFQFFVDNLVQTVRDSIADCIEVSYQEMTLDDATQMMKFTSSKELLEYMEEFRNDWIMDSTQQVLCFQPGTSAAVASAAATAAAGGTADASMTVGVNASTDVPSMKLISQSLSYATEMERIV